MNQLYYQRIIRARQLASELQSALEELVSDAGDETHIMSELEYILEDCADAVGEIEDLLGKACSVEQYPSTDPATWSKS